jgi:hypothetical protein
MGNALRRAGGETGGRKRVWDSGAGKRCATGGRQGVQIGRLRNGGQASGRTVAPLPGWSRYGHSCTEGRLVLYKMPIGTSPESVPLVNICWPAMLLLLHSDQPTVSRWSLIRSCLRELLTCSTYFAFEVGCVQRTLVTCSMRSVPKMV